MKIHNTQVNQQGENGAANVGRTAITEYHGIKIGEILKHIDTGRIGTIEAFELGPDGRMDVTVRDLTGKIYSDLLEQFDFV